MAISWGVICAFNGMITLVNCAIFSTGLLASILFRNSITIGWKTKISFQSLFNSFLWLIIFAIFAYPELFDNLTNSKKNFYNEYILNQSVNSALYANFGFLALALFDCVLSQVKMRIGRGVLTITVIGGVALYVTYLISSLTASDEWDNYLFSCIPYLVYWVHLAFLSTLLVIKYITLYTTSVRISISEFK